MRREKNDGRDPEGNLDTVREKNKFERGDFLALIIALTTTILPVVIIILLLYFVISMAIFRR